MKTVYVTLDLNFNEAFDLVSAAAIAAKEFGNDPTVARPLRDLADLIKAEMSK